MAWSTRELADLAGTTVNTVRHYHRLGLLAQPDRRYNGYKQYGVPHLVRLLRIRRLADLGIPLNEVAGVLDGDDDSPEALRQLDGELAAGIPCAFASRSEAESLGFSGCACAASNEPSRAASAAAYFNAAMTSPFAPYRRARRFI